MKHLLERIDTRAFWILVFIVSVLFVFAFAWVNNKRQVENNTALAQRNTTIIKRQQQQLAYLCETIRVIDAFAVQQRGLVERALGHPDTPPWAVNYFVMSSGLLGTLHDEFVQARGCRQIE